MAMAAIGATTNHLIRIDEFEGEHDIAGSDLKRYSFKGVHWQNAGGDTLELGEYHVAAKSMRVALLALESLAKKTQGTSVTEFATFKANEGAEVLRMGVKITDDSPHLTALEDREGFVTLYKSHDTSGSLVPLMKTGLGVPCKERSSAKFNHEQIKAIEDLARDLRGRRAGPPAAHAHLHLAPAAAPVAAAAPAPAPVDPYWPAIPVDDSVAFEAEEAGGVEFFARPPLASSDDDSYKPWFVGGDGGTNLRRVFSSEYDLL